MSGADWIWDWAQDCCVGLGRELLEYKGLVLTTAVVNCERDSTPVFRGKQSDPFCSLAHGYDSNDTQRRYMKLSPGGRCPSTLLALHHYPVARYCTVPLHRLSGHEN